MIENAARDESPVVRQASLDVGAERAPAVETAPGSPVGSPDSDTRPASVREYARVLGPIVLWPASIAVTAVASAKVQLAVPAWAGAGAAKTVGLAVLAAGVGFATLHWSGEREERAGARVAGRRAVGGGAAILLWAVVQTIAHLVWPATWP